MVLFDKSCFFFFRMTNIDGKTIKMDNSQELFLKLKYQNIRTQIAIYLTNVGSKYINIKLLFHQFILPHIEF